MAIKPIEKPGWKALSTKKGKPTKAEKPTIGTDGIDKVVLNVDMYGDIGERVVRFDMIEISGGGARFASQEYTLSPRSETLAVFQLLDDYYMRRFKFFHSSRSCQSFMLSLAKAEKSFYDETGFSFHEFCSEVNTRAVEYATKSNTMKLGENSRLFDGYSIGVECKKFHDIKQKLVKKEYFSSVAEHIHSEFVKQMEVAVHKAFCGFLGRKMKGVEPSMMCDPVVHLPILTFIPEFAETLAEKCARMYLEADGIRRAGITSVSIPYFALMPNATMKDILSLIREDGTFVNYDSTEECDFVIGKVKELVFTAKNLNNGWYDSIIGYS